MASTAGRHRALRASWALALGNLIALLLLTAVYVFVFNPVRPSSGSQTQPAVQTVPKSPSSSDNKSAPATAAARSQTPAAPPTPGPSCAPTHLSIPELGVDAAVVQIGLDPQGNLGSPSDADKKKAGWYPSALAGAARGSVILTGHTYHDESAIFRTDFDQKVHLGMAVQVSCPDGGRFSYRVTQAKVDLRVEDYSAFIDTGRLYATDGPPQVLIVTCTNWNPIRRDYDQRGVLVASPVS